MTNRVVSDKIYEYVLNISKTVKINTMEDYHDFNLKVYVLLLACVFKTFRKESINSFELDPAHYLSTPGCSWDAMLRFTDVTDFPISKGTNSLKAQ